MLDLRNRWRPGLLLLAVLAYGPALGADPGDVPAPVQRPAYNPGKGPFVFQGRLYDQNGRELRIRGVNRAHWDSDSAAGIARSGANTVRWAIDFTKPAADNVAMVQTQSIDNKQLLIIGNWTATCKSDTASLKSAVATWVAQAPQLAALNKYMIVNIANEWGPGHSTTWRDANISAIASLRAADFTAPILIDSGSCGQDMADLIDYSGAVFNGDPEKNVIFALHVYGSTNDASAGIKSVRKGNPTIVTLNSSAATHPFATSYNGSNNAWTPVSAFEISGVQGMTQLNGMQPSPGQHVGGTPGNWTITLNVDSTHWPDYGGGGTVVDYDNNYAMQMIHLAALARSTGAVYLVGEFGPGKNVGPSPTLVTPGEVITAAEANGIGWLAWAWDDNDLPNCQSDDQSFGMTRHCGEYREPADLTAFGREVVLNPHYGLIALARKAPLTSSH